MFTFYLNSSFSSHIDETLTSAVLGVKEGQKIEGFQAAVTGAAAGLIAQALTTPVYVYV